MNMKFIEYPIPILYISELYIFNNIYTVDDCNIHPHDDATRHIIVFWTIFANLIYICTIANEIIAGEKESISSFTYSKASG